MKGQKIPLLFIMVLVEITPGLPVIVCMGLPKVITVEIIVAIIQM